MNTKNNNNDSTGFAKRLRQLRLQKNLSQSDLANLIDMHYTHISRYERGESKPSSKALKALADAFSVSTDYLYDGDEQDALMADFKDKDFLKIFQEAEQLEEKDREILKVLIESFLARKKIKEMVS